jgi:hypothetical protein
MRARRACHCGARPFACCVRARACVCVAFSGAGPRCCAAGTGSTCATHGRARAAESPPAQRKRSMQRTCGIVQTALPQCGCPQAKVRATTSPPYMHRGWHIGTDEKDALVPLPVSDGTLTSARECLLSKQRTKRIYAKRAPMVRQTDGRMHATSGVVHARGRPSLPHTSYS